MLNMVCAIVDDGKLKKPYVVKEVLSGDGSVKSTNETEVVRQVISEDTSAYMREAMEQVVANGTGKNAYVPGYRVGGKTATSQTLPRGSGRYISSFIGFAPADDPQSSPLLLSIIPQGIYYGGQVAAPIIRQLYENILPYLGLEKTEEPEETAESGE